MNNLKGKVIKPKIIKNLLQRPLGMTVTYNFLENTCVNINSFVKEKKVNKYLMK